MSERLHIHLDVVGGIAGDIFVAGMADAFPELKDAVIRNVSVVIPAFCGVPVFQEGKSGAIRALRFGFASAFRAKDRHEGHHHAESTSHHHAHSHHTSGAHDGRAADVLSHASSGHDHSHGTGRYPDILALIESADLAPNVRMHAAGILGLLAEAEAYIHKVPIEHVHFHEIADWDSVMDVVAAGTIVAAFEGANWSVSDLPLGSGLVQTQHGLLPVPAPATAFLLRGFRWRNDGIPGERITPTGAAILRYLIDLPAMYLPGGRLSATGTGAGQREFGQLPNILRVLSFETVLPGESMITATVSFDIDDMTGEEIQVAAEHLRGTEGVIDVTTSLRLGKKGRLVTSFLVLSHPNHLENVERRIFAETSTIGLRWHLEQRACLSRTVDTVTHEDGKLRVKEVDRPGGSASRKVESDDIAAYPGLELRRRLKRKAEHEEE